MFSQSFKEKIHRITKKQWVLIGLIGILFVVLPVIIIAVQKQQETRSRASNNTVTLTMTPQTQSLNTGQTFTVAVYASIPNKVLTGVDVLFSFNKDLLSASFTPSSTFNDVLINNANNANGTIRFAAVETAGVANNGAVQLGTLSFTALAPGTSPLTIPTLKTTASGITGLLLVDTLPTGSYTISASLSPTPTITPIPSDTPTPTQVPPTPTSTPSPIPTANPTPTTIPSATPTTIPTATPTPLPTSTPIPTPTNTPIPTQVPPTATSVPPTLTNTPVPTTPLATNTPVPPIGDADGNNVIDIRDFNTWRDEFLGVASTIKADFFRDGLIDIRDFNLWRDAFLGVI